MPIRLGFLGALLLGASALLLTGFTPTPTGFTPPQDADKVSVDVASFDRVWTIIRDEHPDPALNGIDWDAVREELRPAVLEADSRDEVRRILNDMVHRLGQSHLEILSGEMYTGSSSTTTFPSHPAQQTWATGCGFEVRIDEGRPVVVSVKRRSAAEDAGVEEGWIVRRIGDAAPLGPCAFTGPVTRPLLAARDEAIEIEFELPDGETETVEVVVERKRGRRYVTEILPPLDVQVECELLEGNIGYIAFNWFFDPVLVMSHINAAMKSFIEADAAGIIIDVRGNGGGLGSMACAIAGWLFEEEGLSLGRVTFRDDVVEAFIFPRAETFDGPVAVLVDRGSGSASEVFAGGMQDLARARVFGAQSMGAVLPAAFEKLPNGDTLEYVIAFYETAEGRVLEGVGVSPDEEVNPSAKRRKREKDQVVQAAAEWIRTERSFE